MKASQKTVDGHHRYVSGRVDIFDMVDIDLFTVVALNMMVLKLGYIGKSEPMFYNYLRPLTSLDEGLYSLACKEDVCCLATHVRSFQLIEVIDDCDEVSFDETQMDGEAGFADVVGSGVDIETQSEFPVSEEQDVGRTQEPIMEEVSTQEPIVAKVSTQEPIVAEVSTHVPIVEEVGTQEFSVEDVVLEDYVSSREDVEQYNGTDDDDDVDEDFLVDEENEIVEPDVDVYFFGIGIDLPFDNNDVTNLVPDDVLEREGVDVINVDGFDSDPGNDEETNYRKIRLAELRTEMKGAKEHVCKEEAPLNNNIRKQIGVFVDMPSEAVEQGMNANVSVTPLNWVTAE
nr:hypothetical protein [Tanacetum cinerariifolium]